MDKQELKEKMMQIHNDLMSCNTPEKCEEHEDSCADCEADRLLDLFTQTSEQTRKEELLAMLPGKKEATQEDCVGCALSDDCVDGTCNCDFHNKLIDEIKSRIERGGK